MRSLELEYKLISSEHPSTPKTNARHRIWQWKEERMKKAMVAVLVVALLIPALFTGCQGVVQGSGKLETREYDLSDFTRVEISSAFEFAISQADSYRVSVTADDNLFQHLDISRDGETLKIGLKTILSLGSATLQAEIAMPRLLEVDISGASSGTASGFSWLASRYPGPAPWSWCRYRPVTSGWMYPAPAKSPAN
jgi:hypothetical protein